MLTFAAVVDAATENADGNVVAAAAALREAIASADGTRMAMHATVARHRLGTLLGGDEGRAMVEAANAAMIAEGIRCPERWLAVYLPGTWKAAD
jgi:hypothetical protein